MARLLYKYDGTPFVRPEVGDIVRTNRDLSWDAYYILKGTLFTVEDYDWMTDRIGIRWLGEPLLLPSEFFDIVKFVCTHQEKENEMLLTAPEEFFRRCGVENPAKTTSTCTTPTDAERYTPKRILKSYSPKGDCTIVFWMDGTKTIVKRAKDEPDNTYNAFVSALAIKLFGNNSKLQRTIKRKLEVQIKKPKKYEQLKIEGV